MNKILIKSVLVCLFYLTNINIKAQVDLGLQAGYGSILGYGKLGPIIGLRVDAVINEQPFYGNINYLLPLNQKIKTSLNSLSSFIPSKDFEVKEKLSAFQIFIGYKRFFGDGDYESNGFYGLGQIGLTSYNLKYSFDSDPSGYFNPYENTVGISPLFGLGLGYQIVTDNDHKIGFELKFFSSTSSFNSRSGGNGDEFAPGFLGLMANYRIPIAE